MNKPDSTESSSLAGWLSQQKSAPIKEKPVEEEELNGLQKQARFYREKGLESQNLGNLEDALSLYQKAVGLDPGYAVAYNDLGIIYEALNQPERAEEAYLKAIKIDPYFLSAYSNLALFYENKRDLNQAVLYWGKRVDLGSLDDPWTQKAKERLADIKIVTAEPHVDYSREDEVITLMKEVSYQKAETLNKDHRSLAKDQLAKAKRYYQKGEGVRALKEAIDAKQLDPSNRAIDDFIDKVQTELLTR